MSSDEIRNKILDLVEEFYFSKESENKPSGKVFYAGRVYDHKEMVNLVSAALDFWLTHGNYCDQFEKEFSNVIDARHSLFVNSGSSANLLAFMTLTSDLLGNKRIKVGDEVITTSVCFPTTVTPIINYGAVPVFVDTDINTLNIDTDKLEVALSNKTKAIMVAHTLGNPFNVAKLRDFCDNHNLWLISDECDALGAKFNGESLTSYSDISTFSFFPAHHITTGEGGMTCTNNALLYKIMSSIRDWGRGCQCRTGQDNLCGKRFSGTFGELPYGYDHKYVYTHFGYNLKATEMQGAIGLAQLGKLSEFIRKRNDNWDRYFNGLSDLSDYFIFQTSYEGSTPSRFGFTITLKDDVGFSRNDITNFLEDNNIQTRVMFAGNILLQPCCTNFNDYKVSGSLDNSDKIAKDTFFVGVYPGLCGDKIDYVISKIREFVECK